MTATTSGRLGPTIATSAIARSRTGNDSTASVTRIRIVSIGNTIETPARPRPRRRVRRPPNAATDPTITPMSVASTLAMIPTVSDVRAP